MDGFVVIYYDERNEEICRSTPLMADSNERIAIPLDATYCKLTKVEAKD